MPKLTLRTFAKGYIGITAALAIVGFLVASGREAGIAEASIETELKESSWVTFVAVSDRRLAEAFAASNAGTLHWSNGAGKFPLRCEHLRAMTEIASGLCKAN
ncbi:hypothetical protein [Variovorax sp. KK3]|uniref:hypothetical protein n=1 Tax=Variovorax sp. KK3 TaxID=1855728 RepID=UPI00097C98AA|nr:hypothetical protein [Variovorax sp. KK3]